MMWYVLKSYHQVVKYHDITVAMWNISINCLSLTLTTFFLLLIIEFGTCAHSIFRVSFIQLLLSQQKKVIGLSSTPGVVYNTIV